MQETQVQSLGQENPLEKRMDTTPVFFPGKFHGQRSLVGYSPWDRKESDTTSTSQLDGLGSDFLAVLRCKEASDPYPSFQPTHLVLPAYPCI